MRRRNFLKGVGATGAALLGTRLVALPQLTPPQSQASSARPNILVIIVDELRTPQWFPAQSVLNSLLPSLARLRTGAVSFAQHYTAANACTPARACLVTGLYAHQHYAMLTNVSELDTGFPTWGTLLREHGYQTYWYGKWHLSDSCDLEPYGFSGGTCPSPNGAPGQGLAQDPQIANQFITWLQGYNQSDPWCTTVSLVNPHDIAWYPRLSSLVPGENDPPSVFKQLPPNYETPEQLIARKKPRLQRALQQGEATTFGYMPFSGEGFEETWLTMLDLYLQLQQYVDTQIGRVLDALEADPAVANNTIILFTSDHGEYCGSHGLRGKGGGAYDEAIRVPLYIKDPTGQLTSQPNIERSQLSSSVDIAPLLLTLASGGSSWRQQPQYQHLSSRLDLAAILSDPAAAGRPYILHTTDEEMIEFGGVTRYAQGVPGHVIGYRTAAAKLGLYSHWKAGTVEIETADQESECYNYNTLAGRMELDNVAETNTALYNQLYAALANDAIPNELRQPLPDYLQEAQQAALAAYLSALQTLQVSRVFLPMQTS
jgi:arylsulfatase A-like enzyme